MDLDLDLDSIFNGFGSGFGFKCVLGLDWILDLKKFMDLDLDLDLFLDMDSNPNPRIQIRTSLLSTDKVIRFLSTGNEMSILLITRESFLSLDLLTPTGLIMLAKLLQQGQQHQNLSPQQSEMM